MASWERHAHDAKSALAPRGRDRGTARVHRDRELLAARFADDRTPFDELAELARDNDVWLGCSCPTAKQPDVRRCHTTLALTFMKQHYRDLDVQSVKAGR
jgi:hypothetical protein